MQIFQQNIKDFELEVVQRFITHGDEKLLKGLTTNERLMARQQHDWRERAQEKIKSWVDSGAFIPSRLALEQCTSERVAKFRAGITRGSRLLNLTGGMGVDDWAMAASFDEIISLDISDHLTEIARYNLKKLGIENVTRIHASAEEWLKENPQEKFDIIYADPDRRAAGKRSALWADASPDMEALLQPLLERADEVWVKSSPLTNLDEFINRYGRAVQCMVIESKGEVKEILYRFAKNGFDKQRVAVVLKGNSAQIFENGNKEHEAIEPVLAYEKYLLEPPPSVIKAGLALHFAAQYGLKITCPGNFWFTAAAPPPNFCGRIFQILEIHEYKPKKIMEHLKTKGISEVLIAKRSFPHSVLEIRKALKLKDGGNEFLLFTRDKIGLKMIFASPCY